MRSVKIIKWHTSCLGYQNILRDIDSDRIIRCAFNPNTECAFTCAAFTIGSTNDAMCQRGNFIIGFIKNVEELPNLL